MTDFNIVVGAFANHQGAVVVGGLGALGAALYSSGIPKDSVVAYQSALKADGFLVMVHGPAEETTRATVILRAANPSRLDVHANVEATEPADHPAPADA